MSYTEGSLDAVIVGAGFSGLYMLHKLRNDLGLNVRVIEAAGGVGGAWYCNRYPGARCDIESYLYCYTFDKQLLQDWTWSERYPAQPEILRYLEHVAKRFDLCRSIEFGTRVTSAKFDEQLEHWIVHTGVGTSLVAQFLMCATGSLSSIYTPDIVGRDTFRGRICHTAKWPQDVDFGGKHVGVIGSGATAVQAIPIIADTAKSLVVFQRTPAFCFPARNEQLDPLVAAERKSEYEQIVARTRRSSFGLDIEAIPQSALEASPEAREAVFERFWRDGGFRFWLGNYQDMLSSKEANDLCADFIKRKIRSRVKSPAIAEKLIPKTYAYGTKRQPLETNYYESFNLDKVLLVDVSENPIEQMTPKGVCAGGREYEIDILIFATGFDAITGSLLDLNLQGRKGKTLARHWAAGPTSYLGLAIVDFPNMFTLTGPGSPSVLSNMIVSIEQHVEWIADCLAYMREVGFSTIEATASAEFEWTAHVDDVAAKTLLPESDSWYVGANIPGKPRRFMAYLGGVGAYRQKCQSVAAGAYEGFVFGSRHDARSTQPGLG